MDHQDTIQRRQELIDVYRRVTGIVWQRLSPTFGIRTINAIARNAVARRAAQEPVLAGLKVSDDGLDWSELEKQLPGLRFEPLRKALDDFLDEFFDALAGLIGRLVVGKIFKEAEREVQKEEGGEP